MIDQENDILKEESLGKTLRKDFLYGLIVVMPIVATIWLVMISIEIFSGPISAIFGQKIPPFFSFILTLITITLIGLLARNIIGRALISFLERLMNRIPIINIIYKSTKQIVNAFSFNKQSLLSAVLVEYPRKGIWALGFITRTNVSGLIDKFLDFFFSFEVIFLSVFLSVAELMVLPEKNDRNLLEKIFQEKLFNL